MPRSELMKLKEDFNFASEVNHDFFPCSSSNNEVCLNCFQAILNYFSISLFKQANALINGLIEESRISTLGLVVIDEVQKT